MKMRYIDVLNELVKGKKMALTSLCNSKYSFHVFLNEDGEVWYRNDVDKLDCAPYESIDNLLEEADWEEYKEPEKTYSFAQAMDMVVNGKRMRRKTYSPETFVFMTCGSLYYGWLEDPNIPTGNYVVQSADVLANDWVEV